MAYDITARMLSLLSELCQRQTQFRYWPVLSCKAPEQRSDVIDHHLVHLTKVLLA